MNEKVLEYFGGDDLAADVWASKYQVKNEEGEGLESTPDDMHQRLAREFARKEFENLKKDKEDLTGMSHFGSTLQENLIRSNLEEIESMFYSYFQRFKYIVPQGSIMSILGHPFKTGSLSNCFVIPSPEDSYGGILKTDEQLVQLMKRRGGVGANLDTLRPWGTSVSNAAGTSTGAPSFMHRYSNSTREVAQDGRRGALMLLMSCLHPDIFKYVTSKKDRTAVTGANISTMLTDKFMKAAKADEDFICRFPVNIPITSTTTMAKEPYNKLISLNITWEGKKTKMYLMKIKAKELYNLIIEMAWENAEPGIAFIDRILNYSPDGVYEQFKAIASNPCGEQWLPAYDSCRLLALNLFSVVRNSFTKDATIDWELLYEISYMQQRIADTLVDLEIEHIEAILRKIELDPEPDNVKRVERELWENVLKIAKAGRRTGCGFTGLGDMLAALGLKYDSPEAMKMIDEVCKIKMQAELDCSIDLAILRGSFEGWDRDLEYPMLSSKIGNEFYGMLSIEFPKQAKRMYTYGRRNVSWSTVAPTGTVSIMTQTTSGLEPLFLAWYMRRKKINPSDKNSRIDFTDQNGDNWQEFAVLHPKFKEWLEMKYPQIEYTKEDLKIYFDESPWYQSTANDIDWEKRVEIQAIIQKYTTNAISSTINLPNDVKKEEVEKIYWRAWEVGLKGVTVYRDGSRTGVLVSTDTNNTKEVAFSQKDAVKRPKTLDCDIQIVKVKGISYTIVIATLDNHPYEVFVLPNMTLDCEKGTVVKEKKGLYNLYGTDGDICATNIGAYVTEEEAAVARILSTSLRHGVHVRFLVEQLNKTGGNMVGFSKAIARVLKKYIPEGVATKEQCPECHQESMVYEEGCKKCKNCGYSKC